MSASTFSARIHQHDEYLLRKKRGFATSFIEVVIPDGRVAAVWTKPRRLVRGFLAVLLAPSAFLGTMILGFWLFGALENDPQRHAASQDPGFWAVVRGGCWAIVVIASPFVVMNWIYPANCLVLKDAAKSGSRRLEVRSRMALTLASVRYTVLCETGETLAVIHRDIFHNRCKVLPIDGGPVLWLSADQPADEVSAISVWMLANGLIMILAAVTLGVVAIPGAISKRGGHYSLWIQDAQRNVPARSIGLATCLKHSDSKIHILLKTPNGLGDRDRLLVLSLSAALWLS